MESFVVMVYLLRWGGLENFMRVRKYFGVGFIEELNKILLKIFVNFFLKKS
jgi:hypothetical protein